MYYPVRWSSECGLIFLQVAQRIQALPVLEYQSCRQCLGPHKGLPVPISLFFNTPPCILSLKAPENKLEASLLTITKRRKPSPTYFSMPRKSDLVKARDYPRTKPRVKVVDWQPRMYSRGIRDVPVEVRAAATPASPPKQKKRPKRTARRPRAETNNALQGETNPQPMDVDDMFWAEESVMPTGEKKVRRTACLSSENHLTYLPVPEHIH
jgi:hypothetical protein